MKPRFKKKINVVGREPVLSLKKTVGEPAAHIFAWGLLTHVQ